jgi:hypothetical protein
MVYSGKHKLLFVSVPKTGTTSLTASLVERLEGRRNQVPKGDGWVAVGEHWTLAQIAEVVGWDALNDVHIVGGVRNPWDRLVSSYNFYKNGRVAKLVLAGKRRNPKAVLNVFMAKLLPFECWLRLYRTDPCFEYLSDVDGNLRADTVIHIETMNEDVEALCQKLGVTSFEPEVVNASTRKPYKEYYSGKSQKLIARRFVEDIEHFNYNF